MGNHNYFFIVNPASSGGRTQKFVPDLREKLISLGIVHEIVLTNQPGHATELARTVAPEYDVVVSVGGDGTINEVVNGLFVSRRVLGIIPVGTGNDFARSCSIPYDDWQSALEILLAHDVRTVDLGQINDRCFISVVGIGFEGRSNDYGRRLKFIKGPLKYIAAIALSFFTYRRVPMMIEVNDQKLESRVFILAIGNGWNVGGGLQLTPAAELDDGWLDITYIPRISRWRILQNFARLFDGTITDIPEVFTYRSRRMRVTSSASLPLHVDGEPWPFEISSLDIRLLPDGLPVIGNWDADAQRMASSASKK